ncbi:glycerate kinase [Nocardioides sp. NPDC047086]|uniref:glycerate kinase family protein n=1 Tax=Nocardioides sp. NPDC047086 TaxID=3154810 RepID=UPI0033D26F54
MTIPVPQRILIAPSGFKESLSADEVAQAIGAGVRRALPGARIDLAPLVDGGEGSAAALVAATGGRLVPVAATGPIGDPVPSHVGLLGGDGRRTAVVEMAAVAGLSLVPYGHRDPAVTTTYGVGELILAALDEGAERILVGCGDSGTCDGGAGALQALGARILDAAGLEVGRGGAALERAAVLDLDGLDPRLAGIEILVACNPHNVLTGAEGVARVFGPQKGATPAQVERLDRALGIWAGVLERAGHRGRPEDLRTGAGTGASGGLGAGLAGGLGATLLPRFEVMFDHVDLDELIAEADLVITAEGAIDFQTPRGKIPAEVARRAKLRGKPVLALAGSVGKGADEVHEVGIGSYTSILNVPMPLSAAVAQGYELVEGAAEQLIRTVLIGCAIAAA